MHLVTTISVPAMFILALTVNLFVVIPLSVASAFIVICIPVVASRGRLHIPGYVGTALLAFGAGLLFGWIAGVRGIAGGIAGVLFSVACFLLIAVAAGSVLAVFFYRHPPEI